MLLTPVLLCLVIGVSDGDTLRARCKVPEGGHQNLTVRLAEVDAPERGQPFGKRSQQHLAAMCMRQQAEVVPRAVDRYGRTVARVRCAGEDASEAMVVAGFAWAYRVYLTDQAIASAEDIARERSAGLWADTVTPVAPWEWRRRRQEERRGTPIAVSTDHVFCCAAAQAGSGLTSNSLP